MSADIYLAAVAAPGNDEPLAAEVLPTISQAGTTSFRMARWCFLIYLLALGVGAYILSTPANPVPLMHKMGLACVALGCFCSLIINVVGLVLGAVALWGPCDKKVRTAWGMMLNALCPLTLLLIVALSQGPRFTSLKAAPQTSRTAAADAAESRRLAKIYTAIPDETLRWRDTLYGDRDYDAVEAHVDTLLGDQLDPTRSRELSYLYAKLVTSEQDYSPQVMEAILDEWVSSHPQAHAARVVRGKFRIAQAWRIRGGGYAHTVPRDAWPRFRAKIEEAEQELKQAHQLRPQDPNAPAELITVARALSDDHDVMERYYGAALQAYPWHVRARRLKVQYLMPKWQGSLDEMFAYAEGLREEGVEHPEIWFVVTDVHDELARLRRSKGEKHYADPDVWLETETICRHYLDYYPDRLQMHFALAYYANEAGRIDVAFEQFEYIGDRWLESNYWRKLSEYNTARAIALWYTAQEKIKDQDYAEAERLLRKSLELQPRSHEPHALLARILAEVHHDLPGAEKELRFAGAFAKTAEQRQQLEFARRYINGL